MINSPLGSQVDFPHYMSEREPPVHPGLCEQHWMLSLSLRYYKCALCSVNSGHQPAETYICIYVLSEPQYSTEVCRVCASTFEITNLSVQKTRCERLFLLVGLRFYDVRSRKAGKVSIYLVFFLFEKQLNVFVYTQRKIKVLTLFKHFLSLQIYVLYMCNKNAK